MTSKYLRRATASAASVFLLAGAITTAWAGDAADLAAKNLAARGGAQKLAAISSITFSGETRFPGDFRVHFESLQQRKGSVGTNCALRVEMSLQGLTIIQAYDGTSGWRVNPFEGRKTAERMSSDEARAIADQASIDGVLLAARDMGSRVEYLGREDIDGTSAYKLRVEEKDGDVFTYFLDPDTYLEIKILERRKMRGSETETETELGEYEQVGGVYFPFSIASGAKNSTNKQVTTLDKGEVNVKVADGLFAMPSGPETAKLAAGDHK